MLRRLGWPCWRACRRGPQSAREVRPLPISDYTADLSGVYLPFHAPLDGNTDEGFIEESIEQARWTYDDLDRYLGFVGRTLDAEPDGDGHVGLSGSVIRASSSGAVLGS